MGGGVGNIDIPGVDSGGGGGGSDGGGGGGGGGGGEFASSESSLPPINLEALRKATPMSSEQSTDNFNNRDINQYPDSPSKQYQHNKVASLSDDMIAYFNKMGGRIDGKEYSLYEFASRTSETTARGASSGEDLNIIDKTRRRALRDIMPQNFETPSPSAPSFRAYSPPPPPQAPPPAAPIVKVPDRDVSYFDDSNVKIGELERLLFQNIGGSELVTLARQDTIDGINPRYTIISNLSRLRTEFDPISLIARQRKGDSPFQKYPIRLSERIPDSKYLSNNDIENFYYIASNGDLTIELMNMKPGELIEVEIVSSATIYEVTNDN